MATLAIRPQINNKVFSWAIAKIGVTIDEAERKYPKIKQWQTGELSATVNQLKDFSNHYHFPFGYFFLKSLPEHNVEEIPFFRSGDEILLSENENVNETVKILKDSQEWLSDYLKNNGADKNPIFPMFQMSLSGRGCLIIPGLL